MSCDRDGKRQIKTGSEGEGGERERERERERGERAIEIDR